MNGVIRPGGLVFDVMTRRGDTEEDAQTVATATRERLGDLMQEVNAGTRPWSSHRELTWLAVRAAVASSDLEPLDAAAEHDLAGVVGRFEPWPDSAPGLVRLRMQRRVVALTNADADELAECSFRGRLA